MAILVVVLACACADDGETGPLRSSADGGVWLNWGAELSGRGKPMVHGEVRLINDGDVPAVIDEVTPIVERGSMQIDRLGVLGRDRPWGSFDNMAGTIGENDFDGASVIALDDVAIPPERADDADMSGHILLVEFRITEATDLYLAGFDITYAVGEDTDVLRVRGGGTVFCIPMVADCGDKYADLHSAETG